MYPIEDTGRFILPIYISQPGRLVSSINTEANWLADIFEGEMDTKRCCRCREIKSISEFYNDRSTSDGLSFRCKDCNRRLKKESNIPRVTEGTKICRGCGETKSVDDFNTNRQYKDGLSTLCKVCRLKQRQEIHAKYGYKLQTDGTMVCSSCKRTLPCTQFALDKTSKTGRTFVCRECSSKHSRACHLRKKYGLTVDVFNAMQNSQNNKCAICNRSFEDRAKNYFGGGVCVDHNHKSGRVRGLLCNECNLALGYLEDNPFRVFSIIGYLIKNSVIELIEKGE